VTFQQVQKYENGKDRIPLYALVSIADYLEVPLSQFIAPSDGDSEFQSLASQFSANKCAPFTVLTALISRPETPSCGRREKRNPRA
jgi:transcriptional regulator with XRE-family HTH domain